MVLAAGLSTRMGGDVPKQLLPYGERTVVGQTVRNAEASQLGRIVVVTGYRADEVSAAVVGGRAELAHNADYATGNMSSFRVGAKALMESDAVIVLLADMPAVTTAMIDRLIAEWRQHRPWAARCGYADGPGHPLLFSAAALRKAVTVEGAKGTWRFLEAAAPGQVLTVGFEIPAPTDINTPTEYERSQQDQISG